MPPPSFGSLLHEAVRSPTPRPLSPGECSSPDGTPCGLCYAMILPYETEVQAREHAVTRFWSSLTDNIPLAPLVRSPRGRAYRTVSKRKLFRQKGQPRLGLIGPTEGLKAAGIAVGRCAIEPDSHAAIYREIEERLADRPALPLAETLQYAIIKGNYAEHSVLFNVRGITPAVVRATNRLSRVLTARFGNRLAGIFLFEGEEKYYLTPRDARAVPRVHRVFGKARVFTRVGGRPFLYPPLAFSQVNESLLDPLVSGARSLLSPAGTETLFDLYCGYGLFGLALAPLVRKVVGAESSHLALAAARENARRQRIPNARFIRTLLNPETLRMVTAATQGDSLMLLDPPRGGTAEGVIEAAAESLPRRVVHCFCNMEILGRELTRWKKAGYQAEMAIPFDMFPGTAELEMMVLFTPSRHPRE